MLVAERLEEERQARIVRFDEVLDPCPQRVGIQIARVDMVGLRADFGEQDALARDAFDHRQVAAAERMAAANGQVDDYVKSSANWGVGGISAPTKAWEAAKPNMMKDPVQQKYEQAQRNFVNALLRKESGAAISEAEFDNARKQYFPQPGDDDSAIEQKRQNRLSVIENMSRSAGGAFNTVLMVAPNGVQKRVPAAEVDHYKALGAKVQR